MKYEVEEVFNKQDAKKHGKPSQQKQIIKGVSGYAMPGQTLFIMGASGAGKTSLLNMLSGRITTKNKDSLDGKMYFNDTVECNYDNFGQVSGYVMQDDILYMHFTPREALTFAANLKLGHLTQEQRDERVNILIKDLGLEGCQHTIIGSILVKTISGGERKRTAIGVELITDPSLILLDEPTSGLDSFKALTIVKLLKKLAKQGKTIISTIH
jgi:ABC-type multidrug transport system ATPase subunit